MMVERPQITALQSQSSSSLKRDKSSMLCNQASAKKSKHQGTRLHCLLLLSQAHYQVSITHNNNLAWKSRGRLVWTQRNEVAFDVTTVVLRIRKAAFVEAWKAIPLDQVWKNELLSIKYMHVQKVWFQQLTFTCSVYLGSRSYGNKWCGITSYFFLLLSVTVCNSICIANHIFFYLC